jgi:hypothetical protein
VTSCPEHVTGGLGRQVSIYHTILTCPITKDGSSSWRSGYSCNIVIPYHWAPGGTRFDSGGQH